MYIQIWMQIRASREVDSVSSTFMPFVFGNRWVLGKRSWDFRAF